MELHLAPLRGHSFKTSLPLELLQEVMKMYLNNAETGEITTALLINSDITAGLYQSIYRTIRVTTFRSLISLFRAFTNKPFLARYTRTFIFILPNTFTTHRISILNSEGLAAAMNTPWEVSPLLAVAPYIRHLEFQASLLHPDALYAIRTTHFPNIVSLRASYKVVLNAFNTITLHKDMVEFPQLRELSVRHVGTPSFTEDLVVDSWNTLVRLHVQIDIMEALRGQPYSANLAHLVSLREVCISFRNSCAVYYAEYLENFVVPSFVEVVIVVINREWYSTGAIQAPPPSARYRYHPALVFVSFRTPYFLRHHHIPDSEHMAHLANRFYTCETTDSWRNIWNQARRMNLSRSKDVVNDGSRVELQYTAMESL